MKKVLFITNTPSPYKVDFFEEIGEKFDVEVLYELKHSSTREKGWENCNSTNFKAIFMKPYFVRSESALCPEVIKHIKKHVNDTIVMMGYSSLTAILAIKYMIQHKIPYSIVADGAFIPTKELFLKKALKTNLISNAHAWCSSGKITDAFFSYYGANINSIYRYPLAAFREGAIERSPISYEEKKELRHSLGINDNNMILYVGSFTHRKGVDILIKATKEMNDTAVVLVGGNSIKAYSEYINEEDKCNYVVGGFKKDEALKKYYRAADLFVLPTREDIWGLVINEAMACGLPVITTDKCIAGLELIKNNINGYIVPADNPEILEKCIHYCLNNKDVLTTMGKKNLNLIGEYSIEKMAQKFEEGINIISSK